MKIGLALGAGAARGWTHIGIIKALEELGLKIDVVAGCSIGAYVGSAYASGNLDALDDWARTLTEWQVLSLVGVGIRRGGLASGQKVFDKLSADLCAPTYEAMQKPFAAVATDLYSGRELVFKQGEVGDSIKASCAIPGLFSPVLHDNRWLIDGAVVNPVPVNVCRQLGADFIIAVNLSSDFRPQRSAAVSKKHEEKSKSTEDFFSKSQNVIRQWFASGDTTENTTESSDAAESSEKESSDKETSVTKDAVSEDSHTMEAPDTPGMFSVMSSSLDIMQARVTRSRLAGEPPDLLIEPRLEDIGLMDFHRAEELIQAGNDTVTRLAAQIQHQLHIM